MADWPIHAPPHNWPPAVTTFGIFQPAFHLDINGIGGTSTWGTANRAIFCPVVLPYGYRVRQLAIWNHSVVSGNVDVGIYDEAGGRIVSTGSTAQSGTSTMQFFDITDTDLRPGIFYLAMAMDNTTGGVGKNTWGYLRHAIAAGLRSQDSAFPLPSTASWGLTGNDYTATIAAIGGRVL